MIMFRPFVSCAGCVMWSVRCWKWSFGCPQRLVRRVVRSALWSSPALGCGGLHPVIQLGAPFSRVAHLMLVVAVPSGVGGGRLTCVGAGCGAVRYESSSSAGGGALYLVGRTGGGGFVVTGVVGSGGGNPVHTRGGSLGVVIGVLGACGRSAGRAGVPIGCIGVAAGVA